MEGRPCCFCLFLQDSSVFADFDVDKDTHVFLRRISFDGFGCCSAKTILRMPPADSRTLLDSVARRAVDDPKVELILRTYFRENADRLW